MMHFSHSFRLTLVALLMAFVTVVCSSNYITPDSLAETQDAQAALNARATVLAASPSPTAVPPTEAQSPTSTTPILPTDTPTPAESPTAAPPYLYSAQSGDSLAALAVRFGVDPAEIASPQDIPAGLIPAGQIFTIPNRLGIAIPSEQLMPDSEVIYSPSAIGFNAASYAGPFGGHLTSYREYLPSNWFNGPAIIERVALENSLNPRLLLSILQHQSNWVLGEPKAGSSEDYPVGFANPADRGLYHQLTWVAKQLSVGYYGWREGKVTELTFRDGSTQRIAPDLNAGTVAIQYLFAQLYSYEDWLDAMDKNVGFPFTHSAMFPDPWVRASQTEPLFPPEMTQPTLSLPFFGSQVWSYTGGPHGAWEREGAMAALDFAPSSSLPGCVDSDQWVTSAAPGLVIRTGPGIVVVDLDGDGNEQTGWVILYLHVTRAPLRVGDWADRGAKLGNPSCEGGAATATHLHIARKYNGEWISAGGAIPFNLSGWVAQDVGTPYLGTMTRDGVTLTACTCSNAETRIARSPDDPY